MDKFNETTYKPHVKYAVALMLKAYGKGTAIPDNYPLYFERECGLTNPKKLHISLIRKGYLIPSPLKDLLLNLSTAELKTILESCGLKKSGKKEDLVKRILLEVDYCILNNYLNDKNYYSLSEKGIVFLKLYSDYIILHKYAKFGIDIEEYENYKRLYPYLCCEDILIFIHQEKLLSDKYNYHYHIILKELYDNTEQFYFALREFLVIKYLTINYVQAFDWLSDELQFYSPDKAIAHVWETQKNRLCLAPADASYFVKHMEEYSAKDLDLLYEEYPLSNTLITKVEFSSILHDMSSEAFFDYQRWNTYILSKLEFALKRYS